MPNRIPRFLMKRVERSEISQCELNLRRLLSVHLCPHVLFTHFRNWSKMLNINPKTGGRPVVNRPFDRTLHKIYSCSESIQDFKKAS